MLAQHLVCMHKHAYQPWGGLKTGVTRVARYRAVEFCPFRALFFLDAFVSQRPCGLDGQKQGRYPSRRLACTFFRTLKAYSIAAQGQRRRRATLGNEPP